MPLLGISGGFGRRRNGNGGSGGGGGGGDRPSSSLLSSSSSGEFDSGPAGVTLGPEIRLRRSNVSACGSGETVAPTRPGSVPTKGSTSTETTGTMIVPTMTTIAPSPPTTTTTMATGTKTLTTSMEALDGSELCHYPPLTHSCWSRGSICCAVTVSPSLTATA